MTFQGGAWRIITSPVGRSWNFGNALTINYAPGKRIPAWSYGSPTNAELRAIRDRGGAGASGAAGPKCLISETISEPMSLARCVRLTGECCTMIFDGVDSDVFQYYLDF